MTAFAGNLPHLPINPDIYNPDSQYSEPLPFYLHRLPERMCDRDTVVVSAFERIGMDIYDPSGTR